MFTFLIVLISFVALVVCVSVLLQSGKGGGLAATFGGASSSTDSFMGGRQAASVLTRTTWVGGGLFLALALVLAVLSSRESGTSESILRQGRGPSTALPPSPTSVLERELVPTGAAETEDEPAEEGGVGEPEPRGSEREDGG